MRKKIYVSLLAMGFACMAITVLISGWFFWQAVQRQAAEEMHVVMNVISNTIQKNDDMEAYLQGIADGCEGSLRITWINPDGTIRFESKYDKWQMENHLDRPEVQEALNEAYGTAVRKSHTLSRDLYYMAEQMPDGTILRLSMERESIYSHFLSLLPVVVLLLLCAAVACIKASRMLTASLLNPLRRTVLLMRQIGDPNGISVPASYHVDAELRPLVDKIIDQSQALNQLIHSLEQQRNIVRLMMENLQEGVILTDDTYRILGMNRCAGDNPRKGKNLQCRGNGHRCVDAKIVHRKVNIVFLRHQQQELQHHRSHNPVENLGERNVLLPLLLCLQPLLFQLFRLPEVIAVKKGDPGEAGFPYAKVPCFGDAPIFPVLKKAELPGSIRGKLLQELFYDVRRMIFRAVIYDQKLPVREGLGEDGVYGCGNGLFCVICRHDDADHDFLRPFLRAFSGPIRVSFLTASDKQYYQKL